MTSTTSNDPNLTRDNVREEKGSDKQKGGKKRKDGSPTSGPSKGKKPSVTEVAAGHPVLIRYLAFTRDLLSAIQSVVDEGKDKLSSPEITQRLAEMARSFYYFECAKSGTHRALPLPKKGMQKDKKASDQAPIVGLSAKVEKESKDIVLANFIPLRTRITRIKDTAGEVRNVTGPIASGLCKESEREIQSTLQILKRDTKKVLTLALAHISDDGKTVSESDANKAVKDNFDSDPLYISSKKEMALFKEAIHVKFPILKPINAVDIRQFAILKENGKLLDVKHIKSYLSALQSLSECYKDKVKVHPENFGKAPIYTMEEINWNVEGMPNWPRVRKLGRAHPKIIAMQLFYDGAGDVEIKSLFKAVLTLDLFQYGGGPYQLHKDTQMSDEEFEEEREKWIQTLKSGTNPRAPAYNPATEIKVP